MSCKHPLKRFILPDGSGKVCSYDTKYLLFRDGHYIPCTEYLPGDRFFDRIDQYQEIPCGHCYSCHCDNARQWADRMLLELQYHEKACFVTLTYDDDHLPPVGRDFLLNEYTGEVVQTYTLVKEDLQKFIKKLRNDHRDDKDFKIRFYGVGEYGEKSQRPHYHVIIYGYDFPDKVFHQAKQGNIYYRSPELESIWKKGFSLVCNVTWETCAYCAQYVTKKLYGSAASYYEYFNIIPEFALMSRNPGIGRLFYDDHKREIFTENEIIIPTIKGKKVIKPPRYYDKLFDIDYPEENVSRKAFKQEMAEIRNLVKMSHTSKGYLDQLIVEEANMLAKSKERSAI